ncbi:MAG: class I SAM-dependent methyltransferase [Crenarchaeota archaeon]|nr:class I SAM-dependent methyltransferase [Thermoproteota archaeon]
MIGIDIGCGSYCRLDYCVDTRFDWPRKSSHLDVYLPRVEIDSPKTYIQADAHEIPLPSGVAELAYMIHSLEHMNCPMKALLEARRLLKPYGRLYIIVPNPEKNSAGWRDPEHKYSWTTASLKNLLEASGYHILLIEKIVYELDILAIATPAKLRYILAFDVDGTLKPYGGPIPLSEVFEYEDKAMLMLLTGREDHIQIKHEYGFDYSFQYRPGIFTYLNHVLAKDTVKVYIADNIERKRNAEANGWIFMKPSEFLAKGPP